VSSQLYRENIPQIRSVLDHDTAVPNMVAPARICSIMPSLLNACGEISKARGLGEISGWILPLVVRTLAAH